MKAIPSDMRSALWCLLVAAFAACSPTPTMTPTSSAAPATIRPAIETPTRTPLPAVTPTQTPEEPISTFTPSPAPTASPIPPSPTFDPARFTSIQMMDRKTGWAMADIGVDEATHLLRTEDGGATWRDVSPADVNLIGSFFLDAQQAWAWILSGGLAWRTQDGGLSWTPAGEFGSQPYIGFNDSLHGWKLDAEVWGLSFVQFDIISFSTTQDGGLTWQDTNPPPEGGTAYMAFPSAQMAWAVRAGFAKTLEGSPNLGVPFRIQATFDGGSTWTTRQMPLPAEATLVGRPSEGTYLGDVGNCAFFSPVYSSTAIWKLALTCESSSWMYTTANQGKTWIISAMPAGIDAQIQFINPTVGWLFLGGWLQDFQGDLYQTTDGGQSWTLIKPTGWGDVRLSFVDAQTGWAVACKDGYCYQRDIEKELLMTTDGGQTWQALAPQLSP